MNEFLYASPGFEPDKDFAPIMLVGMLPMVISANPSFAANSVAELVAAAKQRPDKIDVALPSTAARLVLELLKQRTRAPLLGRPYKGPATPVTELMVVHVRTPPSTVPSPPPIPPHTNSHTS